MKTFAMTALFFMLPAAVVCHAQSAPVSIGGFALGKEVKHYAEKIRSQSAMPIRYREYVYEAEINPDRHFTSGLIAYGTCDAPGKIVRIKLKYRDTRRTFYDTLLEKYKARFGKPAEWRGDPFGIVLAWKWSFVTAGGDTISLTLQHNTKDAEEKVGNAVKLTLTSQFENERRCFEQRHPASTDPYADSSGRTRSDPIDWQTLIPE